jgi:hypothetical protein
MKAAATLKSLALPVIALILASTSLTASAASDRKVIHGSVCQPYFPTTDYADLRYRVGALSNQSTTEQVVICPIEVDVDDITNWQTTDGKNASIEVTFYAGEDSTPKCTVYVGSNIGGTPAAFSAQLAMTAGDINNVSITGINGDAVTHSFFANYPAVLYCTLPAKSSLLRIRQYENSLTDTP